MNVRPTLFALESPEGASEKISLRLARHQRSPRSAALAAALEDMFWSQLSNREFLFNH